MSLFFLSVWHSFKFLLFNININDIFSFVQMNVGQSLLLHCGVLHLLNEALRRFEAWLVVCADFHCCLLEYVSRCFSGAMLNDETSKSTQVHILFLCQQTVFDIFLLLLLLLVSLLL